MTYQHKYKAIFGHKHQPNYREVEVYAFDLKSAVEVAMFIVSEETNVGVLTNVGIVKDETRVSNQNAP